jgi:ERI1 exoribonuclease 3
MSETTSSSTTQQPCADCGRSLPWSSFSQSQLRKKLQAKCQECVLKDPLVAAKVKKLPTVSITPTTIIKQSSITTPSSSSSSTTTSQPTKPTKFRNEYLCILDFEATCDNPTPPPPWVQEIIEFPSVLLKLERNEEDGTVKKVHKISEFESFVQPKYSHITPFCEKLTTITTKDVKDAPFLEETLEAHWNWLQKHITAAATATTTDSDACTIIIPPPENNVIIVTCGDWDLKTMLPTQFKKYGKSLDDLPAVYKRWINVKHPFQQVTKSKHAAGMQGMLTKLGLPLLGTHHRGIDDCRNIAHICEVLMIKGLSLFDEPTEKLFKR